MAAYYHTHGTADVPDHGLHHTLILMNPHFSGPGGYAEPQPHPSHNVLLLNSAAAAAAASATTAALPLHHQFAARGHQLPPQQENITLYGYPQSEPARELTRSGSRQGLSLSLSSQNRPYRHPVPPSEGGGVADGGAPGSVLGSKYLTAAQELLEEVVHVGDGLLFKTTESPKKTSGGGSSGKGAAESPEEKNGGNGGGGGDGGAVQLSSAERQELQMKKAKLVTMLDEAEQRYRQYHHQMQIVIASFEQAAGVGSAKTYTSLALKTISKQFRCLKDAIQAQIRAASKSLGEEPEGGGGGSSGGNKLEGSSRLKYIDHQIRQQRALQQLGMIQNHNAWRPQRGLPERSVSVLRAWLFEHFLHPYPKDSDKIMLAKQTGLTRSQVSNWFINARVRLWKPMIEEMYTEEIKEQELQNNNNGSQEQKTAISSKENSNVSNSGINDQEKLNIYDQIQATTPNNNNKGSLKDQTVAVSSFNNNMMLEMDGISQGSPKRPRNAEVLHNCDGNNREIFIKFGNDKQGRESNDHNNGNNNGYPMISGSMNFVGGGSELSSYPTIGEMGRFGTEEFPTPRFLPGNGISLSLGLPPCENHHQQQLNLSATNHTFLSPNPTIQFRRADDDFGSINNPSSHSQPAGFECIDIQNRKGFAAQLLPDFVVN